MSQKTNMSMKRLAARSFKATYARVKQFSLGECAASRAVLINKRICQQKTDPTLNKINKRKIGVWER